MSTRRSGATTIVVTLAGLSVLACAAFVWLLAVEARDSTTRMTEQVTKAVAEARARDPRRTVIRGEGGSGQRMG